MNIHNEGSGRSFVEENIKVEKLWDKHWNSNQDSQRMTLLGELMFASKCKVIKRELSALPVKTVLEIGCGMGHTLEVLRELHFEVLGVDLSGHAVGACKRKGLNAEVMNVRDMSGEYDLIFSDGMLEHFLNFQPYVKDMIRLSRKYVALIQPNHASFWGKTLVYFAEFFAGEKNMFEYNYRIDDFIAVFSQDGYVIKRNIPILGDVFRFLLFKKGGCDD